MSDKPHSQIEDLSSALMALGDCVIELRRHNARVEDERRRAERRRSVLAMEQRIRAAHDKLESEAGK